MFAAVAAMSTRPDSDEGTFELRHLRRLWPFVRPYRRAFAVSLLILLVSFGLEVVGPYLVRRAIDGPIAAAVGGAPDALQGLTTLALAYAAVTLAAVALGFGYAMLTAKAGQRVIRDMRCALFEHLLSVSPRFHDRHAAGRLVTRVTADVENLNELISTGVLQALFDLLKIFGTLAVLFWIDAWLALVTVLLTPLLIGISLRFRAGVRLTYRAVRHALGAQNGYAAEAIGGVRVAKLFTAEQRVADRYTAHNHTTRDAWLRTVAQFALFVALVDGSLRLGQVAILAIGTHDILHGALSTGAFVQFWLYYNRLTEPIRELGEKYNVLQSAMSSCERLFAILDEPRHPAPPAEPKAQPRAAAHLTFDAVSFAYGSDRRVLHDVSFEVRPGENVALVGPTGAGKSTVLALASRLDDPTAGRVLLDGAPLPTLDLNGLRRRVAVVPQEVVLFSGTILDNLRLFDDSIDEDRAWQALAAVGADDIVAAIPGGLRAPVQERGATLSVGQRQLLSFARALVHDPDLLILDEATASIDSDSEATIQSGLRRVLQHRTALVVAHRLSTVRRADRILVMQDGRIVERGTHEQLARADGCYARMLAHG